MRVLFVQYMGDYREAVRRIQDSGHETYYAQQYSVEAVASLATGGASVTVLCCVTATIYDELLANGVRAIGLGFTLGFDEKQLVPIVAALAPDNLIARFPCIPLFQWAAEMPIRTLAILADSFRFDGLRGLIRKHRWSGLLNHPSIEWVLNHGINSCLSLHRIGVSPEKLIPWDWPPMITPDPIAKTLQSGTSRRLLFVGAVIEAKGVGDILTAISLLKNSQPELSLTVIGAGEIEKFTALANTLGIAGQVEFLGLLPHHAVIEQMKSADLVVVPSHHNYSEGFPMVIYETLCSRTPLVASDHPMFRCNLTHLENAWIYPAKNSAAMAEGITRLLSDATLYHSLSQASDVTWSRLQLPVRWAEAVTRWLSNSAGDRVWFHQHRLNSGLYPLERFQQ
jgi:glycosyltransferase involved in cell wall biosynthesis